MGRGTANFLSTSVSYWFFVIVDPVSNAERKGFPLVESGEAFDILARKASVLSVLQVLAIPFLCGNSEKYKLFTVL